MDASSCFGHEGLRTGRSQKAMFFCEESMQSRVLVAAFDRNCQKTCHDSIFSSDSEVYKKTLLMQHSHYTDYSNITSDKNKTILRKVP